MKLGISAGPNYVYLVYLKRKNIPMCAWDLYGYLGRYDGIFDDEYSCHIDWIEVVL